MRVKVKTVLTSLNRPRPPIGGTGDWLLPLRRASPSAPRAYRSPEPFVLI